MPNQNKNIQLPVEVHCPGCCPPEIRDAKGCCCNGMNDGIVTVYSQFPEANGRFGSHHMCRTCAGTEKKNV